MLVRPGMTQDQMREALKKDIAAPLYEMWTDNNYKGMLEFVNTHELPDFWNGLSSMLAQRIKYFISDYAKSKIEEFVAEAFTSAINSPNPSMYATMVKKIIDDLYLTLPQ